MNRRAVTYHRVSTVRQDETLAREQLRAAAVQRDFEVVREIEETGSGARNDRPGLQAVMDMAAAGAVGFVLVWKLDRFGRSVLDVLTNVRRLESFGVTIVATSQGLEMGPGAGAHGKLMFHMLAALAEFERDMIRERTALGIKSARDRGTRFGRTPVDIPARGIELARALRGDGVSWGGCADQVSKAIGRQVDKRTLQRYVQAVERSD